MTLVNIGFNNLINAGRVLSYLSAESQPVRRLTQEAKANAQLIDCTHGHKTRCVLVLDSGHVVLSYLQPETLAARLGAKILTTGEPHAEP